MVGGAIVGVGVGSNSTSDEVVSISLKEAYYEYRYGIFAE